MPSTIELCCKGGPKADTGGTGRRTEWGKMNLSYHNKQTQTMEIEGISLADICIILHNVNHTYH